MSSIIVSGAGIAAANGTYTQGANDGNGNPTYVLAGTTYSLEFDPSPNNHPPNCWNLSNQNSACLYYAPGTGAGGPAGLTYTTIQGIAPAPTVAPGLPAPFGFIMSVVY